MYTNREAGMNALQRGDFAGAIDPLEAASRQDPNDARLFMALGAAYGECKRHGEAVVALQHAAQLQPNVATVHYNLGIALARADRGEEALAALNEAVRLQPDYSKAIEAIRRLQPDPAATVDLPAPPTADFVLSGDAPAPESARLDPTLALLAHEHAQRQGSGAPPPRTAPAAGSETTISAGIPAFTAPTMGYASPGAGYAAPPPPRPAGGSYYGPADAGLQRRSSSGMMIGIIIAIAGGSVIILIILGALLLPAFQRARQAASRLTFQASNTAPGLAIFDPAGVSCRVPVGFPPARMIPQDVATGGFTALQKYYGSRRPREECFLFIGVYPQELFNAIPAQTFLDMLLQKVFSERGATLTSNVSTSFGGSAARELRMTRTDNGQPAYCRARVVLAAPRIVIQAFEAREESLLTCASVNAYFSSLTIGPLPPGFPVPALPAGMAPRQFQPQFGPGLGGLPPFPSGPAMPPPNFGTGMSPGASPPGSTWPGMQRPNMPEIPQPQFGPVGTPPGMSGMPSRDGPPFGPGVPVGPRFGPMGPGATPGDPGGSAFPPSGPPGSGGPPFGPGGPPSGFPRPGPP